MFERPHHRRIAQVLHALNAPLLRDNHCLFGGGTAIAMRYGEYRESVDMDFRKRTVPMDTPFVWTLTRHSCGCKPVWGGWSAACKSWPWLNPRPLYGNGCGPCAGIDQATYG